MLVFRKILRSYYTNDPHPKLTILAKIVTVFGIYSRMGFVPIVSLVLLPYVFLILLLPKSVIFGVSIYFNNYILTWSFPRTFI